MTRQSPPEKAKLLVNTIRFGNDKHLWVSKPNINGIVRWVRLPETNTMKLYEVLVDEFFAFDFVQFEHSIERAQNELFKHHGIALIYIRCGYYELENRLEECLDDIDGDNHIISRFDTAWLYDDGFHIGYMLQENFNDTFESNDPFDKYPCLALVDINIVRQAFVEGRTAQFHCEPPLTKAQVNLIVPILEKHLKTMTVTTTDQNQIELTPRWF